MWLVSTSLSVYLAALPNWTRWLAGRLRILTATLVMMKMLARLELGTINWLFGIGAYLFFLVCRCLLSWVVRLDATMAILLMCVGLVC